MFKFIAIAIAITCIFYTNAFPQASTKAPAKASPAAASADAQATIVSSSFTDDGAGNFAYAYETSNTIKANAKGQLKDISIPAGADASAASTGKGEVQEGSFSYTAPDGTPITVTWIADENGENF